MSFSNLKTFDPYNVLDVDRTSSLDEIKSKFRKLTLKYHPDRNRRNRDYDLNVYNDICKAYAILSDTSTRKEFDTQYAASWMDLRESTRDYVSSQNKMIPVQHEDRDNRTHNNNHNSSSSGGSGGFGVRGKFSEGDLASFNSHFDQHRSIDPNDHGYGDEMTERMTEKDRNSWSSSVTDVKHDNVFQNRKFDKNQFNDMFEERSRRDASKEIIERSEIDPSAYSLSSQGGFADIAVFDGNMIVGKESRDYTKAERRGGELDWVDYKQGFVPLSGTLPSNLKDKFNTSESVDRLLQQRMAEYSRNPYDDIPAEERKSFSEAKEALIRRKEREMEREQKQNREIVLKYKSQYKDNYLDHKSAPPPPSSQTQSQAYQASPLPNTSHSRGGYNQSPSSESHIPNSNVQLPVQKGSSRGVQNPHPSSILPVQHTTKQDTIHRMKRYQPLVPVTTIGSNTSPNTAGNGPLQTRDRDDDAKNINDRLNDRNFMI